MTIWAGNPGMYKASDRTSVRSFARDTLKAHGNDPKFAEWLVDNGLMIPHEDQIFRDAREVFDMTHGAWLAYCMEVEKEVSGTNEMTAQFFIDMAYHILYGTDTEDENSVGGFSQREIDLIANWIADNESS